MSFNYKNPISPLTILGNLSVTRTDVFGTNFSVLGTGGYMEVYSLSDLLYTIPSGSTGLIEFSSNTIPIQFNKGIGTVFSPDVLTLNSDNISSGRRRIGMLVYVIDQDQIYQYQIPNFSSLWSGATGATGPGGPTVVFSEFGTTVKNNTPQGISFISAWTANTIEGISGETSSTAVWKKLVTGGGGFTGGTVSGATIFTNGLTANTFSASTYLGLPSDIYITGGTFDNNTDTLTLLRSSGSSILITGFTDYFTTGATLIGDTIYFDRNDSLSAYSVNLSSFTPSVDVHVTGATYDNANTFTFTNNTGGTFDVSFDFVTGLTINGDLTVTGNTNVQGLTATTISATTYQGLPIDPDTYVTAFTYNNNVFTIEDNSGTTFNTTINDVTGLTINGDLTVTGNTTLQSLTATTISATTYQNLPTDVRVTGGTYSGGTAVFTNNTGGTFNVSGFYTGDTDNDRYTTGFTYNDNTFTLTDNSGNTLTATINDVTGLTVNGDFTVTGDSDTDLFSATTINIKTSPSSNNTESSVLVRNSSTGDIEQRNINSLINTNNTITVALTGSTGVDFNSIKDAVISITGATSANTYTVQVAGGVYNEDPFTIPSWVSVVGESSISTVIQANDSSQTLINLSDQSGLFDCQVQGCTGTSVSAILYSSSTTPQSAAISYVENVRFGSNYTHAKVVAYGGANIIMQCSNVKYGGQPFTEGFYATNSGSGVGRMQLRNVTSTNGGIVSTTGLIFAKADATSCGFIVNGCLLTKEVGAPTGTGFYVENGGFLRLTAVNFQRWAVGIDAPQIGSAPSIDAIALNFENNTIDVNITHSGATGKIQGPDNFLKTIINQNAPLYEVNQDPKEIVVAKKGGDFTSIKSAVDYLIASGNTSSTNRYIISIGPGEFIEGEIDLTQTPYVSIVGSNIQTTLIKPSGNTQNIINVGINNEISFLTLSGAPSGYAGIYCYDIGDFGQAHKISMYDCDTNIWVESNTQDTKFYGEYVDFNGTYTYGTKVIGNNGYLALANMENYFNFPTGGNVTTCNYASGSGATLSVFVADNQSNGVSGSTAYYIQDGAGLYCSTITVDGFTYGIRNPNIGLPIRFDVDNASFVDGEWDLYIERLSTFGTFGGSSNHEKVFSVSDDVYWAFLDIQDGEFDITRKSSVTFTDGSHTDFTTLIFEGGSMGLMTGGTLTTISGTTVQADGGFGYVEKSDDSGIVRRIDWSSTTITLSADSQNYIFINENGILGSSGSRPISDFNIILGRVVTDSTGVEFIDLSPFDAEHTSNKYNNLFSNALGPIYANGSIVTEGSTAFTLDVSAGEYYFSTNEFIPTGGTPITFSQYYRNGTGSTWVVSSTTVVNNTQYDNNGTLTGLTSGYYTKHTLYVLGESSYERYFLVLGQNEYSTLVQAEGGLLPTPPTYFSDAVTQIASIYIEEGTSGITQIEDIRPVIGFKAGGVNASSVHGNLLGLAADDHTQYLLVNGGRAMSGNLDMGGNNIVSAGTINGVTIESHAIRHQFAGVDPVGTVTPSANAIPYADVSGKLDSWISTATTSTLGLVKISTAAVSATNPIVVGENDNRFLKSFTGGSYSDSTKTLTFTTVDGTSYPITGFVNTYLTAFTYNNNTFTISDSSGNTLNATFNNVTGLTVNGNLTVTGNTNVQALTGTSAYLSGSGQNILTIVGSGSSTSSPLMVVSGSSGELFNITDSLVGTLFSVNNVSGNPILSVDSSDIILMGNYLSPSLNSTIKVSASTGTTNVYSIPTSAYTGAFFDYTVNDGTNLRAGNIMSIWSGSTIQYSETSTTDIGNTSGITFNLTISSGNAILRTSGTTSGWTVKTIIRSI
jgi:hypothetical protein